MALGCPAQILRVTEDAALGICSELGLHSRSRTPAGLTDQAASSRHCLEFAVLFMPSGSPGCAGHPQCWCRANSACLCSLPGVCLSACQQQCTSSGHFWSPIVRLFLVTSWPGVSCFNCLISTC